MGDGGEEPGPGKDLGMQLVITWEDPPARSIPLLEMWTLKRAPCDNILFTLN